MKCLCCGKEIGGTAADISTGWHKSCIRKFFGTGELPWLDISDSALMQLVDEATSKGYTVPGVQKKMSLHLAVGGGKPRLTLVNYPTGYILKPQAEQFEALPEAEYLAMQMAKSTGIATVPFALLRLADSNAYITKRIDRVLPGRKDTQVRLFAMEDFCQLDLRLTEDKYRGSYERCAKIIARYSIQPGLDLSELFMRLIFCYVVGNSDMHLKNFSLIETAPGNGQYVLSAAYDLLPVNVILPEDTEQMALALNGKKRNLHRNDFLKFAASCGISADAAEKMIRKIISMRDIYQTQCAESYIPAGMKERFSLLIDERIDALRKKPTESLSTTD